MRRRRQRAARAAVNRAQAAAARRKCRQSGPTNQPGISGLAIDAQDHIYVFNRGPRPVMVFDTAGNLIMSGADQEINGKKINPDWEHSGDSRLGRQRLGDRARCPPHREAQSKTRQVPDAARHDDTPGNDATHFNLPSGIGVLRNGNIVVTDGYGNNRDPALLERTAS